MQELFYSDRLDLPKPLFGVATSNEWFDVVPMVDFEISNYTHFIDNVPSLEKLIEGLALLSPFVDDALDIAESMQESDFCTFKLALPRERKAATGEGSSCMPESFVQLLLPDRFLGALLLGGSGASLGVALIRMMEVEAKK